MTTPRFATFAQAEAAGYVRHQKRAMLPGGSVLRSLDMSAHPERVCGYGLSVTLPKALRGLDLEPSESRILERTEPVWIEDESNAGGGAYMYSPEAYARAIAAAEAWVADLMARHADVVADYQRWMLAKHRRDTLKCRLRMASKHDDDANVARITADLTTARAETADAAARHRAHWAGPY